MVNINKCTTLNITINSHLISTEVNHCKRRLLTTDQKSKLELFPTALSVTIPRETKTQHVHGLFILLHDKVVLVAFLSLSSESLDIRAQEGGPRVQGRELPGEGARLLVTGSLEGSSLCLLDHANLVSSSH